VVGSRPLRSFFGPEGQGADPLEEDVTLPEAKPALA
jgi:hypothetical protein